MRPTISIDSQKAVIPAECDTLKGYMEKFLKDLEGQGYSPWTLVEYRQRLKRFCDQVGVHHFQLKELDEDQALALLASVESSSRSRRMQGRFMVRRFIRFLADQGVVKLPEVIPDDNPRSRIRRDFEDYLRRQRGLSESSIFNAWRIADRFLMFRFGDEIVELSGITANDIVSFMQWMTERKQPLRTKSLPSHLRNFLRFLFKAGLTETNLSMGIPSIAQRYGARLPRHLEPEQVEMVLQAVRGEATTGRRDHAMVLLIARLGLRPTEVVAIQMEDIDWRAGEILVRGKGGRHDRVPLPPDVGEALADYIRMDRQTASRTLFVTKRAPHAPFRDSQILNSIIQTAFARIGLDSSVPYVGSQILRHSLATNLVRRGASLDEIGNMLRHRSKATTLIYAKLDIEGLRTIAPPWPVAGGAR
jgi:site-specific recombinase XerD